MINAPVTLYKKNTFTKINPRNIFRKKVQRTDLSDQNKKNRDVSIPA